MEPSEISRRNVLKSSALGVGAFGTMSVAGGAAAPATAAESAAAPAAAFWTVDMFLKIDGIPGESRDSRHAGEIDVLSFAWGVARTSGQNFGRPAPQDITFAMHVSKASPLLMFASAKGTRIASAVLVLRTAGQDQLEFYKLTLENCKVTSYQTAGSSEAPTDSFSLEFSKVTMSYAAQGSDGKLETPIVVTYP